ncbi:MAG: FAD-dependent oxidoreductase [Oscillospiraceae bacterium]|jgi:2,4-dienoyl-CoA reductase (NADPH2)|nr:FAD-dependent oxidoreductase [Oscillospiraceae bacterium]
MLLERLFTPLTINGLTLRNRAVMPAIHHLYTPDGAATERFNDYYYRRAEGGAGLLIVGGCSFDDYGKTKDMMSLQTDAYIPGWRAFTDGIHKRNAKVAVQLYHAGRYAKEKNLAGKKALSASAVYASYTRETPRAMTKDEIRRTIALCAQAAVRAGTAGFDAVELSASAGYLICQFLSPITNLREDEYGGSWENRCRFAVELIAAVRGAVGPDYPLFMRIAGNDFVPGSNTNEDAVRFAGVIAQAGIDMIDVTGGWHESRIPQITGDLPRGGYVYLAEAVRGAVSVPVMASNRINDPLLAEQILAQGSADLIALGRPLIADPDWVKKAAEGRPEEIRPCMACNQGCLAKTFFGKPVECLVNGEAGREYRLRDLTGTGPKRILVVGAGPAGCTFAAEAAERGHQVTLWEKSRRIGGQLEIVAAPPGKDEFTRLADYYRVILESRGVRPELGKEARAEDILVSGFDAVVLATGSSPRALPLPEQNDGSVPVVSAWHVLERRVIPGKNVVIVGGGSVGCETAQYLAHQGSISPEQLYFLMLNKAEDPEKIAQLLYSTNYTLSLLEITDRMGANFEAGTAWPVFADLKRFGVRQLTSASVHGIENKTLIVRQQLPEGEFTHRIPCDTLVAAVGSRPENGLYAALAGKIRLLHVIGDAKQAGKISDAVTAAVDLAATI